MKTTRRVQTDLPASEETKTSHGPMDPDGWRTSLEDPYRSILLARGTPDLDRIMKLLPRPQMDPPFDQEIVASNIARLSLKVSPDTDHELLDRSVLTGLALIDATFQGHHPKYGTAGYAQSQHDAFPPTLIAVVDALSGWGLLTRAEDLFDYWLNTFVRVDGSIDYYAPSLSEYGQILDSSMVMMQRGASPSWWRRARPSLIRLASWVIQTVGDGRGELITGCPEADEADQPARYFHNNAWLSVGIERFAQALETFGGKVPLGAKAVALQLMGSTLSAMEDVWPKNSKDLWLPPHVEPCERPECATGTRLASYTNYRYWPELLSSGILSTAQARRVLETRLHFGGQFLGMTRFSDRLDDWPIMHHMTGLWRNGCKDDFLLCLYGHLCYHQEEKHLAAPEQMSFPPGTPQAPFCLPSQLTAARAVALMQGR